MPTSVKNRDPTDDRDWVDLLAQWTIRPDTIYLNHGSFGLSPNVVRYARRGLINQLDQNPMDFYLRQFEPLALMARKRLAEFIGTQKENLVFVDNATYGMNVVAKSFPLQPDDEVLLSNHEYGAVKRIWERRCREVGAKVVVANLPKHFETHEQVTNALLAGVTSQTKLLIVSHITSATALILPAKKICRAFAERGIPVCIDGPHAPAHIDLNIEELDCDFYTASCHKWLCAPLGTGFLYAKPKWHEHMQPIMKSWGRLLPAIPETWDEEFTWMGTRDPSGFLSIPTAIDFLSEIGLEAFRDRTSWLANDAEKKLTELFGTQPLADRNDGWYGTMAHVPMPDGDWSDLQKQLWEQSGFEIALPQFEGRWFIRISCHLYNSTKQLDGLVKSLKRLCRLI